MTTSQIIFSIYIFSLIALYFLVLPKIFKKAGHEQPYKGYIPFLNIFEWLKVLKQPWWWVFFFIPWVAYDIIGEQYNFGMLTEGVAFLMLIVLNVTTTRLFGNFTWQDTLKMIVLPHWALTELAFKDANYFGETDWHNEELVKRREAGDHLALFFSLPVIGHVIVYALKLVGQKRKPTGKTLIKEWTDAILFAVVAASIIRAFVFEPFTIPTPSMEKDLLVGDYLFVSKMSYGTKLPNTPLSIPFFHNYIPVLNRNSYVEWSQKPYRRLPGFGDVERNDIVVFNFPAGDTAIFDPGVEGLMGHTYSEWQRKVAFNMWTNTAENKFKDYRIFEDEKAPYMAKASQFYQDKFGLVFRPVDKRENYIKRCVAVAGDVLEIKGNDLFINGTLNDDFEDMQFQYDVDRAAVNLSGQTLLSWKEEFDIVEGHLSPPSNGDPNGIGIPLTAENVGNFKKLYPNANLEKKNLPKNYYNFRKNAAGDYNYPSGISPQIGHAVTDYFRIFPNHPDFNWSEDNFGPLAIPARDMTIPLNDSTNILYNRCITVHEHNTLEKKEDGYYLNGQKAKEYTFKMNYYWLMGDNRHRSADSRFWGFVPEDHVVGKAVFIWMSVDPEEGMFGGGIRTNRLFTAID